MSIDEMIMQSESLLAVSAYAGMKFIAACFLLAATIGHPFAAYELSVKPTSG